jgi:hypothetical protein
MAHQPRDLAPRPDAGDLPASSHQPSTLQRADGWTPRKQVRFLETLAATHSVSAAAREVGMTRQTAYRLRARLRGRPFDLAWEAAFRTAFDALKEAAMDRALNGVEVPHFHNGELIHCSRRFDERLTVALLAMRPTRTAQASDDFTRLVARVAEEAEDDAGEGDRGESGPDSTPVIEDLADWRLYRDAS